jgi:hypothetical protein
MADIDPEDALELVAAEDEQPVQALAPHAADPALDARVGVRRPQRRPDHPHPLAVEDGVERAAELRVTVVDQEPRPPAAIAEVQEHVACLLRNPAAVGLLVQAMYSMRRVPMQMNTSTYSRRSRTVSTVRKSQASVVAACWRRTSASPAGRAGVRAGLRLL